MKQRSKWKQQIAAAWPLGDETLPLQPILELCGERRVLIENHRGVTQYAADKICVSVRYGQLEICGAGLRLCRMAGPQLVVLGRIDTISVVRGKAK